MAWAEEKQDEAWRRQQAAASGSSSRTSAEADPLEQVLDAERDPFPWNGGWMAQLLWILNHYGLRDDAAKRKRGRAEDAELGPLWLNEDGTVDRVS